MKNLRIAPKLTIGFAVVILCTLIVSGVGISNLESTDQRYGHLLDYPVERLLSLEEISKSIVEMRRTCTLIVFFAGDDKSLDIYEKDFETAVTDARTNVNNYKSLLPKDNTLTTEELNKYISIAEEMTKSLDQYMEKVGKPAIVAARAGDTDTARQLPKLGTEIINDMVLSIDTLIDSATLSVRDTTNDLSNRARYSVIFMNSVAVIGVILSMLIAYFISKSINRPIQRLLKSAEEIANGNLNINLSKDTSTNEIGLLTQNFNKMIDVIKNLIDDLNNMGKEQSEGDIDSFLDTKNYPGAYGEVAQSVNNMISLTINDTTMTLNVLEEIVDGNFEATLKPLPGKKALLNQTIDKLRLNINRINNELSFAIQSAISGDLKARIDVESYSGGWKGLMAGLNDLLLAFSEPITEVQIVMEALSVGDFSVKISGDYEGDLLEIKKAINSTVDAISFYIKDISITLDKVANYNLTTAITNDYVGDFVEIKDSINKIVGSFHRTLSEIVSASEQVNAGAKTIAESSSMMASGASEQASSVNELSRAIDKIDEQTHKNTENAQIANELSEASKKNVLIGDSEMKKMLVSMDGIKEASNNISTIIKTIEDIAFQTNLLALNAAVEAARAGTHGKGFSVVAEEVRVLATKSQLSVKETADLIEQSISRVEEGTLISHSTAKALETILHDVNKVSGVVSEIAKASEEQSTAISEVTVGLGQISEVVQSNSATSEESAATAQELSSQSETLNDMVSEFVL